MPATLGARSCWSCVQGRYSERWAQALASSPELQLGTHCLVRPSSSRARTAFWPALMSLPPMPCATQTTSRLTTYSFARTGTTWAWSGTRPRRTATGSSSGSTASRAGPSARVPRTSRSARGRGSDGTNRERSGALHVPAGLRVLLVGFHASSCGRMYQWPGKSKRGCMRERSAQYRRQARAGGRHVSQITDGGMAVLMSQRYCPWQTMQQGTWWAPSGATSQELQGALDTVAAAEVNSNTQS